MKPASIARWALLAGAGLGVASGPVTATPVISELFYDASGSDAGLAFVELFAAPGESLDGLVLEGVNGGSGAVYLSIDLNGTVPADGVFLIGDDDGSGATSVAGADFIGEVDYQNGPDSVLLRDAGGILDAVGYGVFGASDIFAGEGAAAPDAAAGSSIARLDPRFDSDDNSLDFVVLADPTPGSVPVAVSSVPLPAGAWLFGSGLAGLATIARRDRRRRAAGVLSA
ncbi:MAG: VPLPA-CTERM sorting domain-containing protein [Gammaproteobacteria bacterium]|jgi:hypothetical protein